jgi:putative membrane protein
MRGACKILPVTSAMRCVFRRGPQLGASLRRLMAVAFAVLASSDVAWAHGAPLDRPVGLQDWNWDPVLLLNLSVLVWLYSRGWRLLVQRSASSKIVNPLRGSVFALGMIVIVAALISPLDPLSGQLGWAHMVQHMLLMTVAAPLLMASSPALICLYGLPDGTRQIMLRFRRRFGQLSRRWLWDPLVIWSTYAIAMWIWHVPALYEAALRDPVVHDLQHLTFFISACLFWRLLLDPVSRLTLHGGIAVLYLFTTTLHATVLGVFMTISPSVWYPEYEGQTHWWGLTALEDQQLAGLIMWMPACAAYAVVAVGLFARALEERTKEPAIAWARGTVVQ